MAQNAKILSRIFFQNELQRLGVRFRAGFGRESESPEKKLAWND